MTKIFKSLRRNGKNNLRITNENISNKNATGCICIEIFSIDAQSIYLILNGRPFLNVNFKNVHFLRQI